MKISIDRFLDAHKIRKIAKTTKGRNSLINEDGVKNMSSNITNCSKDLKALDNNVLPLTNSVFSNLADQMRAVFNSTLYKPSPSKSNMCKYNNSAGRMTKSAELNANARSAAFHNVRAHLLFCAALSNVWDSGVSWELFFSMLCL